MSKVITLLGSTGSIGTQSLDVCRMHGYEVFGLSANSSVDKLLAQIAEFHPKHVAVTDPAAFEKLSAALAGQANAPKLPSRPAISASTPSMTARLSAWCSRPRPRNAASS